MTSANSVVKALPINFLQSGYLEEGCIFELFCERLRMEEVLCRSVYLGG